MRVASRRVATRIRTLRTLRTERDLTQIVLAKTAGISREYLGRLEAARQNPTLGVLDRIANALKVPLTALVK
jgi:transcriptional regulator with XRE-family HTH domain